MISSHRTPHPTRPASGRSRAALRVVSPPAAQRGRRRLTVAVYAAGLTIGFLLVALVSMPTGGALVPLTLAGVAGMVAVVCVAGAGAHRRGAETTGTGATPAPAHLSSTPSLAERRAA